MTLSQALDKMQKESTEIAFLCTKHYFNKLYNIEEDSFSEAEIQALLVDYPKFQRYLNDYAGVIYRRHMSSIEDVYAQVCTYFGLEADSQYLFEFALEKIESNTPAKLMQIEDDDLKYLTIEKFESKIEKLEQSSFYQANQDKFGPRLEKVKSNFAMIKKALHLSDNY